MPNPVTVNCDACSKKFEIKRTHKKFLTDEDEGKVTIHYFTCSHCRKRYVAYVENLEVIKLKKKNKKLYGSIREMRDQEEITTALQTYEEGVKKVKHLQSKLKLKFKA